MGDTKTEGGRLITVECFDGGAKNDFDPSTWPELTAEIAKARTLEKIEASCDPDTLEAMLDAWENPRVCFSYFGEKRFHAGLTIAAFRLCINDAIDHGEFSIEMTGSAVGEKIQWLYDQEHIDEKKVTVMEPNEETIDKIEISAWFFLTYLGFVIEDECIFWG